MGQQTESQRRVLVLHPDAARRDEIVARLAVQGYDVTPQGHFGVPFSRALAQYDYSVILLPLPWEPGDSQAADPLHGIRELRKARPQAQLIALVEPTVDLATCCQAVSVGVCGFVECPDGQPGKKLEERVSIAFARFESAQREGREIGTRQIFDQTGFAGQSKVMADLLLRARRAAAVSDAPVLIFGESGTGKQLLAEAIHRLDPKRRERPFLTVNCAAIVGTLAESELFGHKRGAFTGATEDRRGLFRAAEGGILLLDEISELPRELQPKLLRVLQAGTVLPVGADAELPVDVRIIAASNRSLEAAVADGQFRLDLFQRLNVIRLELPPLRQRPEDVPQLIRFFVQKYASYYHAPIEQIDPRAVEAIQRGIGDGNVRELENLVRHVLATKTSGSEIGLDDLPPEFLRSALKDSADGNEELSPLVAGVVLKLLQRGPVPLAQMLDACEKLILEQILDTSPASNSELSRRLGITRRTFYNKVRKYGLTRRARN